MYNFCNVCVLYLLVKYDNRCFLVDPGSNFNNEDKVHLLLLSRNPSHYFTNWAVKVFGSRTDEHIV